MRSIRGPSYIAVFIYLAVLTGVELLVYAMNFPTDIKIGLLVALAMAKACWSRCISCIWRPSTRGYG